MIEFFVFSEQISLDPERGAYIAVAAHEYDCETNDEVGRENHIYGPNPRGLTAVSGKCSAQTLADMRQDPRIYVLTPGPGYSGNALQTWLSGHGAGGADVRAGDDEETAKGKAVQFIKWEVLP